MGDNENEVKLFWRSAISLSMRSSRGGSRLTDIENIHKQSTNIFGGSVCGLAWIACQSLWLDKTTSGEREVRRRRSVGSTGDVYREGRL